MKRRLFFTLLIVVLIVSLLLSGCTGTKRINDFFQGGEYKQHDKLIDFMVFFMLFFALTYLGFSKWFGEGFGKPGGAKGAVVGLSVALSLALTFSLVTQTKFSITTIFPLAKAILFLAVCLLLYGLLNQIIEANTATSKVVVLILAFILGYILLSIFTHFTCQMSNNMDQPACKSDFFNAFSNLGTKYIWGSGGFFGGGSSSGSSSGSWWPFGGGSSGSGSAGGAGGGAAGSGGVADAGTGTDKKSSFTDSKSWLWIGLIVLLLLVLIFIWARRKIAPWKIRRKNRQINDLLERLRQLTQTVRNVLNQLPTDPATYPIPQRDADYLALRTMMDTIRINPHVLQRQQPENRQIDTFFNEMDAAGNFARFPPLQGRPRDHIVNLLKEQKIIEWEISRLMHGYRMLLTNRDADIQRSTQRLRRIVQSPKFYPDRNVELMFDARRIPGFNADVMPNVRFVTNTPPRMNKDEPMELHSSGIYRFSLGRIGIFQTDYLFVYAIDGTPNDQTALDEMNPVTNAAGDASYLEVDWTND